MPNNSYSKTRLLSPPELQSLRERLRFRFRERQPLGKEIEAKTYLGAYEALQEDMTAALPNVDVASLSLNRFRKLFYYTDPDICPPDQLERPSFGKDFLHILEKYIAGEAASNVQPARSNLLSGRILALLGVLVCLIAGSAIIQNTSKTTRYWREDFTSTHPDSMTARGWEISNYDSSYWHQQHDTGVLTLYTLAGDYWVKPNEKRVITNLVSKAIQGENLEITCKIVNFQPYQLHQQAGLILFDRHKDRKHHIRFNFSFAIYDINESEGSLGSLEFIVIDIKKNGDIFPSAYPVKSLFADNLKYPASLNYIKLIIKGNLCRVYIKQDYDWSGFILYHETTLDFTPAYIALAAFHGWTFDDGSPKCADAIPAAFDWVEVKDPDMAE
ncbi:MAG: hypothetical protein HUU34_00725 [Saprospiraceae bacterium]|nr:hypothetical protein [Saprospiraceae bacterium]